MKEAKEKKRQVLPALASLLLGCIGICYVLRGLTGWSLLWPRAAAAGMLLIVYLPRISKAFRVPAWIFTFCGAGLLIWKQAPAEVWAAALNSMLQTVAIIAVMQTLSISIGLGNYSRAISDALRRYARDQGVLFFLVEVFAHLLCSILNIGEAIILLGSFDEELKGQINDYPHFVAGAITPGHSTAFLWAPGSLTVLLTLQIFGLEWSEYVLPALCIAAGGMVIAGAMRYPELHRKLLPRGNEPAAPGSPRKLAILGVVILVIVCSVSGLEPLMPHVGGGERLIVSVAVVSAVWLLSQCCTPGLGRELRRFCTVTLPDSGSLGAFFISMGLFSHALQYVGLDSVLDRAAAPLLTLPPVLLLAVVPLIIIAFSMIGVHPMVSLAVLGSLLTRLVGDATALQLALATALGCGLSYMISPFAGLILLLSHLLQLPPREVALKQNLRFSIVYYVVGIAAISLLGRG